MYHDKLDERQCQQILEAQRGLADSVPKLLYPEEDVAQRRMMGEELDLARAVKEHIVLYFGKYQRSSSRFGSFTECCIPPILFKPSSIHSKLCSSSSSA